MSTIRCKYNSRKIALIKQLLSNGKESGNLVDYEIKVDDLRVVLRNNDPDLFDNHEDFITEDSKHMEIILYDGSSRRNTRHLFIFEGMNDDVSLNGNTSQNIDQLINEKINQERMSWDFKQLESENDKLKSKLKDAEAFIDDLHETIDALKSGSGSANVNWGEIASVALEGLIKRNSHLIPGLSQSEDVAGVETNDSDAPKTKASFKKKSDDESGISENDKNKLAVIRQLEEHLDNDQLEDVMQILSLIVQAPNKIKNTINFLTNNTTDNA